MRSPRQDFVVMLTHAFTSVDVLWNGSYKIYEGFNANPVDVLSTNWIADAGVEEGGDRVPLNGMETLPNFLAKNLDVRLRTIVQSIVRDERTKRITVKTDQGSFEAPYVLNSLPLGVLKDDAVKFSPSLPDRKQGVRAALFYWLSCFQPFYPVGD